MHARVAHTLKPRKALRSALRPLCSPASRYTAIWQRAIVQSTVRSAESTSQPSGAGRSFEELKQSISHDVLAIEKPSHFITTLTYGVSLYVATRLCVEAGIFRRLAESSSPISAQELANGISIPSGGAATAPPLRVEFVQRLLRAVYGLKLIDEAGPDEYIGNELTRTLAHPGFEAGVRCMYRNLFGPSSTLTATFDGAIKDGYEAPDDAKDGPLQRAFGTVGTSTFESWANERDSIEELNIWMQRIQQDRLNWSSWFPEAEIFGNAEGSDRVLMVDVGGGLAHDLNGFAGRYPDRNIRLVSQDQPDVTANARQQKLDSRIELMEHNFFGPQPVKGAHIYFMHKIMHDWPDHDCATILSHLRDAMADDSRLFLNDAIIPDQGSPVLLAAFDLSMLTLLSAKERSETMWTSMIKGVGGLKIKKFWQAPGLQGEGIVEVVKDV